MPRPKSRSITLAAGAVLLGAGAAQADLLYYQDFQSGSAGAQWSAGQGITIENKAAFTKFLGRYSGNQGVVLRLPPPAAPAPGTSHQYELTFDLYAIDSWDGSSTAYGPDTFQVKVGSTILFSETISNQHTNQTFRPPDIGPVHMDYNANAKDSIYRAITIPFTIGPAATEIYIRFQSVGLQVITDESWGIDNVGVSYTTVPAPAGAGLLGLAGLVAMRRRRN